MTELEKANQRIAELEAHYDYLTDVITDVEIDYSSGEYGIDDYKWQAVAKALDKTPKQSLAKIKADAIREAVAETRIIENNWIICDAQVLMDKADELEKTE